LKTETKIYFPFSGFLALTLEYDRLGKMLFVTNYFRREMI